MAYNNPTPEVLAIGNIPMIDCGMYFHSWVDHLKIDGKKAHLPAIMILSEIYYWYKPTEKRDEVTGVTIALQKKFKADKLQKTYQAFANRLGLTYKQARDACQYLKDRGLITLELRTITTEQGQKIPNCLFIGIIPEAIAEICKPYIQPAFQVKLDDPGERKDDLQVKAVYLQVNRDDLQVKAVSLEGRTNTEITTEITTEENTPLPPLQGVAASAAAAEVGVKAFGVSPGVPPSPPVDDRSFTRKRPAAKTGTTGTRARIRGLTTEQIVERMAPELQDCFKKFWGWYCKFCSVYDVEPGDKNSAAAAFQQVVTLENLEDFRKGTLAYAALKEQEKEKKGQAVGIPHCCRFVAGNKTSHPTPYWKATLEAISDASEGTNDFGAIHKKLLKEHLRDTLGEHPYTSDGSMALKRHINDLAGHVPDAYKDFNKRIEPFKRKYASFPDLDHFIEAAIRFNWLGLTAEEKAAYHFKVYPRTVLEVDYIDL